MTDHIHRLLLFHQSLERSSFRAEVVTECEDLADLFDVLGEVDSFAFAVVDGFIHCSLHGRLLLGRKAAGGSPRRNSRCRRRRRLFR